MLHDYLASIVKRLRAITWPLSRQKHPGYRPQFKEHILSNDLSRFCLFPIQDQDVSYW